MAKKKTTSAIVHKGRAANCMCKDLPGPRCPDCNHLWPEGATKCACCNRVKTSPPGVVLEVQDVKQKGAISNG